MRSLTSCMRELSSSDGGFYSALDADSEGVEGKFYTFTKADIEEFWAMKLSFSAFITTYTDEGNWEEEHTNVLFKKKRPAAG